MSDVLTPRPEDVRRLRLLARGFQPLVLTYCVPKGHSVRSTHEPGVFNPWLLDRYAPFPLGRGWG